MPETSATVDTVREDIGTSPVDQRRRWATEIAIAEKTNEKWVKRGNAVLKRYRDEARDRPSSASQFNILWSNTEVMKPAVFSQTPKVDVRRRIVDPLNEDPDAREVAIVLERVLEHSIDIGDFDEAIRSVRDDYLLPGRGVAREHYVPITDVGDPEKTFITQVAESLGPDGVTMQTRFFIGDEEIEPSRIVNVGAALDPSFEGDLAAIPEEIRPHVLGDATEEVLDELTRTDYVFWEDYLESPARSWKEVRWVAYRHKMTRQELRDEFTPEIANKVELDWIAKIAKNKAEEPQDFFKRATVWEIWDKESRERLFFAVGLQERLLRVDKDPLKLENFFPNPDPLDAIRTTEQRVPIPIFQIYEDQAHELDRVTQRIERLIEQLKVRGIYDGSASVIGELMKQEDGDLLGVDNAAAIQERGGMQNLIFFAPLQEIIVVLQRLYEERERIKQTIFELIGLSDIIRGSTDPRETRGAQQIKAEFGSLRLREPQQMVQRYVRDQLRIKAEIIAEHFSAETLSTISGREVTESMMELMRNDGLRSFRIDIETDSTIEVDEGKQKQESVEMISAVTGFLQQAGAMIERAPETGPFLLSLLRMGLRSFKIGRLVEEQMDQMSAKIEQGGGPGQEASPEQQIEQGKLQLQQQEMQFKQQAEAGKMQADAVQAQLKAQIDLAKVDVERQKVEAKVREAEDKLVMDRLKIENERLKLDLERAKLLADRLAPQAAA